MSIIRQFLPLTCLYLITIPHLCLLTHIYLMVLLTSLIITFLYRWNYEKSIEYLHKNFPDYLSNETSSTICQQPTDKLEK